MHGASGSGLRVQALGFKVQGSGFKFTLRVQGGGFRVGAWVSRSRVRGLGFGFFRVKGHIGLLEV